MTIDIDAEQIRLFWKFINPDNKNRKFQIFKKDKSATPLIDVNNVDKVIELVKKHKLDGLSCLSVNNTAPTRTKTDSITEIKNILIDIDVKKSRKKDGVSTDEDKTEAKKTAEAIIKKLEETINLRISLFVDSGNGYHIYIPINVDLADFFTGQNVDENKELWDQSDIKGKLIFLENLLKDFNTDVVEIDCISKDIVRRAKIPGTWNVKESIPEENYRIAKIVESYEDALTEVIIESNTTVFNAFTPYKEPDIEPDETSLVDFSKLLKNDTKLNDLFNGDWDKKPYNQKKDGTPKDRWTRSEAEHTLLCKLIWYDLPKEQIYEIMAKCKIGKWKDAPDGYKKQQYNSSNDYITRQGGTKTTSRQIPIKNDGKQIATLKIIDRNKFCIMKNDNTTIYPPTKSGVDWFSSPKYRNEIITALTENIRIIKPEAKVITNNLCAEAYKKINHLERNGAFKKYFDDEKEDICKSIEKVIITRSDDGNIYSIHIKDQIIPLSDKDILNGAEAFRLQYLNKFLIKIDISKEEWNEHFLKTIFSEDKVQTNEDKIDSNNDIITSKFLQLIKSKNIFDWKEMKKRTAFQNALFYDHNKDIILICSDFINKFFENEKIELKYKTSPIAWASYLHNHNKKYLNRERTSQRIKDDFFKTFWMFNPVSLSISKDDIVKEEPQEDINGTKNSKLFGGVEK